MLVVMRAHATEQEIAGVCERIHSLGFRAHVMPGAERAAVRLAGNQRAAVPKLPTEHAPKLPATAPATHRGAVALAPANLRNSRSVGHLGW